jgi:toxin-antitoxin system PIN domain toxin
MSRYLLDVNVLLALLWQGHDDYETAQAWFAKTGRRGWATNPLTQLGFLRLLTNPAVTHGGSSPAAALGILAGATSHECHEFWPLNRELSAGLMGLADSLQGYRQWTDAVLLWHAMERGGVLVTFDAGIKALAGDAPAARVLVLKRA